MWAYAVPPLGPRGGSGATHHLVIDGRVQPHTLEATEAYATTHSLMTKKVVQPHPLMQAIPMQPHSVRLHGFVQQYPFETEQVCEAMHCWSQAGL